MEALWSTLFTVPNPKSIWLESKKNLVRKIHSKASFLRLVFVTKESRDHRGVYYNSVSLWPLKVVGKKI